MASVWLDWPSWVTIPAGPLVLLCLAVRSHTLLLACDGSITPWVLCSWATSLSIYSQLVENGPGAPAGWQASSLCLAHVSVLLRVSSVAIVSFAVIYRFEHSRIGMTLKAVAQSHLVASSVGVNERRWRILAVGFACFFAGLMGALYAHYNTVASPTSFGLSASLWIIMYTLVGGSYSSWGPVVVSPFSWWCRSSSAISEDTYPMFLPSYWLS
jgi:ABC-type branched-subunit amino acid transport system permease subunit